VQGINDLVTPFFHVFLSQYISKEMLLYLEPILNILLVEGDDPTNATVDHITDNEMTTVEADSFWCLTKLLDGIQVRLTRLTCATVVYEVL
jgi:hypothetical protein